MSLQYLSDDSGKTTAVVIPIQEWKSLLKKHTDLKELDNLPAQSHIPLMSEFTGLLSKKEGKALQEHLDKSRNEWDRIS